MDKMLSAAILGVFLTLCGNALCDTNILSNPGFEDGTSGWTQRSCSISAETATVYNGSYSGKAYDRTATWQGIEQSVLGKMVEGQPYSVSGWVRTASSSASDIHITFKKVDDGNNGDPQYQWAASGTASSSGWTYISGNYTLSVSGTLTQLSVYVEGPNAGVDLYIDDIQVYGPQVIVETDVDASVDVGGVYQTIEGFGAAGGWYESWLTAHPEKETLYDLFFEDLGLDMYRVRNTYDQGTSGASYITQSAQIVSEGLKRNPNLKILITSWSPPAYLKSNADIAGGNDATLTDDGNGSFDYEGFADWWADSVTAWSAAGVAPTYISIQNELDYDATWDSCRFDPTQTSTTAGYDQALIAVYNEMYSRFATSMPKIIGPETTGFNGTGGYNLNAYLSAVQDHSHLYGYCHHLYNINAGDSPDDYLAAMVNVNSAWSGKPLFQTEYEKSTAAWPDAFNMALLLHNSLAVEEVAGYFYWSLFWAEPGGLVSFPSYGSSDYTINSDYYGFKQYSAFILPGYKRIDAEDDSNYVRISAYLSPDGTGLTVVILNTHESTDMELTLSFPGIIVLSGDVYRTSQTENCAYISDFDPDSVLTLPAMSVTTLSLTADTGTIPPAEPAGLNAAVTGENVSLSWDANTEADIAGYNVYRSTESGSGYSKINESPLTATQYLDNTAANSTVYYYVVTAVDTDSNESGYSNQTQAYLNDADMTVLSSTDFENGMGDWSNITDEDTTDWTLDSDGTPSPNTGPDSGANDSAWYVYLETSSGGADSQGDTAILQSEYIYGYARTMTFYYHMYGADTGTLNVDVYDGTWHRGVWTIAGQQHSLGSEEYTMASVDLTAYTGLIMIRLRAVAAGDWRGDIAVDEIEITGMQVYGDMNRDNIVNFDDIGRFGEYWLSGDCDGQDVNGDCFVNLYEFSELAKMWLDDSYQ